MRLVLDLTTDEVPECDFIVLHGVYAWVSPEVRAGIQRMSRSDRYEFCVATQTNGLSGVLRFAARLLNEVVGLVTRPFQ